VAAVSKGNSCGLLVSGLLSFGSGNHGDIFLGRSSLYLAGRRNFY